MITHAQIRQDLEEQIGIDLPEAGWGHLVERGLVDAIARGELTTTELVREVSEDLRAFAGVVPMKNRAPEMLPRALADPAGKRELDHSQALSIVMALLAARTDNVREFRSETLGGRLLAATEVESWIKERQGEDGPETVWLRVPLSASAWQSMESVDSIPRVLMYEYGTEKRFLRYGLPGDRWERVVATAVGKTLERLRELSVLLSRHFGWSEAQATLFVLTGDIPFVAPVVVTARRAFPDTALSRINLAVRPDVSPRELLEIYSRVRRQVVRGRQRDLSEKHLRLALFTATRPGKTWAESMAAWNELQPGWRYKNERNFRRDCVHAFERMLRPVRMGTA